MIKNEHAIVEKAESILRTFLKDVPFLKITEFRKEKRLQNGFADFIFKISAPDYQKTFIAEAKPTGQPRVAREAVNQLLRMREAIPHAGLLLVAPYISDESVKICTQDGINYVDLAGNCLITFGGVYIRNQGNPNPYSEKRELRSLFSPKATRILRVLLADPKAGWKAIPLGKEAQVSLGQVSNVRKLLEAKEWAVTDKDGLKLTSPEPLLKEWRTFYNYRQNEAKECYSMLDAQDFEKISGQVLKKNGIPYAFTGFTATEKVAPMVRYKRVMLFVPLEYQQKAMSLLELKDVMEGSNVSILAPYDEGVFYGMKEMDGIQVVSPIQAYLDLSKYRGRGEEAAQETLRKAIKPLW